MHGFDLESPVVRRVLYAFAERISTLTHSHGLCSRQVYGIVLTFTQKYTLTNSTVLKKKNNRIFPENSFDILCNLSPKAAICQTLFSAKDKKKINQNVCLCFPSMLRTRRVLGLRRNVHTCTKLRLRTCSDFEFAF